MAIDLVRTLDMSVLYEGSEAERLASAKGLFNCFAKQGFVKLVNHLISDATVEKAFEYVRLCTLARTRGALDSPIESLVFQDA